MDYQRPNGCHEIPHDQLDLRPDAEVDRDLIKPPPVSSAKNIWLFWNSGFSGLHPYTKRNVRTWHRRFSRSGWTVRVMDLVSNSPLNINNFLDTSDPTVFPKAFREGTIAGTYGPQHTSDLVRWPLLLKYGGVYADVGMIQIGDLDRLWNETIGNPSSPYEVLSYNMGGVHDRALTNYFLCSRPNNPMFERCERLLLALWDADGGKTTTDGMHASPLLKGIPLLGEGDESLAFEENGRKFEAPEVSRMLTDYIIQGQAMTMVMGLVDEVDGWNGPEYVAKHVYAIDYMEGSQWINELTAWDGPEAFRLMSLSLPKEGEKESDDQKKAREIVEECLKRSFGFKLAHGLILRVMGDTLGSLWRRNEGSDVVRGTYADWLRFGTLRWCQDGLPESLKFEMMEPYKKGPLLRES
ncbi:uncharacterized protein LTR77_001843 [Saxophila tyrrhenica]|uniref:Capsule polysaccharide biosynthesis protein n=1 Tax=Saxophila tyrrhenica TaxID=1690608 RepID=A0AAV9PLC8_9PEZI|nr:hypothetical protein LTR77_001843 [Saxophila tyrrhenica]